MAFNTNKQEENQEIWSNQIKIVDKIKTSTYLDDIFTIGELYPIEFEFWSEVTVLNTETQLPQSAQMKIKHQMLSHSTSVKNILTNLFYTEFTGWFTQNSRVITHSIGI